MRYPLLGNAGCRCGPVAVFGPASWGSINFTFAKHTSMKPFYSLLLSILTTSHVSAISVNGTVQHPTCGLSNGCVSAWVSGGTGPYNYQWSPVPPNGQGTPSACGMGPGVWTLTVTDANAEVASADFTLINQPGLSGVDNVLTYVYEPGLAAHHACPGQQQASICVLASNLSGTPPYNVTVNGMGPLGYDMMTGNPYFGYFFPAENLGISVTDANGCVGYGSMQIDQINTVPFSAENVDGACGGLANGSADLMFGYSGPFGPSLYITDQGGGVVYSGEPWTEPFHLGDLAAGTYTVQRTYSPTYFDPPCQFTEQFTIPDLGVDCGTVSGTLYIDNDQDCVQDPLEVPVPYRVMEIQPGPQFTITDDAGHYSRNLLNGAYTIAPAGTDLFPICPGVQPVPFTIADDAAVIDLADSSTVPLDVQVTAASIAARPGFIHSVWSHVRNLSAQISGPVTVTATFDPVMSLINAAPTPTTVNGNVLTWELPAMSAYADVNIVMQLQVPADAGLIGQPFAHTISASQTLPEQSLVNNTVLEDGVITGSYDPNDKTARTSTGWSDLSYYLDQDQWIDYVIRFQNTGTDTAFTVVITDTLAAELDMGSFQQGLASHPFSLTFKDDRVVEWRFENILLPDSGTNEPASHGLVAFRIKPVPGLLPGSVIANIANIYFDFNEPVITEPSVLTAEFSTGINTVSVDGLQVFPNPARDRVLLVLPRGSDRSFALHRSDGRAVSVDARPTAQGLELDVATLPPGLYTVRTAQGSARFVKQ